MTAFDAKAPHVGVLDHVLFRLTSMHLALDARLNEKSSHLLDRPISARRAQCPKKKKNEFC